MKKKSLSLLVFGMLVNSVPALASFTEQEEVDEQRARSSPIPIKVTDSGEVERKISKTLPLKPRRKSCGSPKTSKIEASTSSEDKSESPRSPRRKLSSPRTEMSEHKNISLTSGNNESSKREGAINPLRNRNAHTEASTSSEEKSESPRSPQILQIEQESFSGPKLSSPRTEVNVTPPREGSITPVRTRRIREENSRVVHLNENDKHLWLQLKSCLKSPSEISSQVENTESSETQSVSSQEQQSETIPSIQPKETHTNGEQEIIIVLPHLS